MSCDQSKCLLVTSGDGPRECRRAVSLCLARLQKEARSMKVELTITVEQTEMIGDPASALVRLEGPRAAELATRWIGTVNWVCQSPFRPHHKRRNWFIGVFCAGAEISTDAPLAEKDLKYETFRAGGPGGQHQNTTDSAVRLTHLPSGTSVISRDGRSQHRNKEIARMRLDDQLALAGIEARAKARSGENKLHKQLERGNAARVFRGVEFSDA